MNKKSPILTASFPTYRTKDILNLLNDYVKEGLPDEDFIMEKLLSVALCHDDSDVRKLAKKVAKKHGNEALKAALKLKSRRNYTQGSGNNNVKGDLKELEEIDGFVVHQFARFLYQKESTLRNAFYYFEEYATDEEFKIFFRDDFYEEDEPNQIYFHKLGFVTMYLRVAKCLVSVLNDIKDDLALLEFRTEVSLEDQTPLDFSAIDFESFPNLYKISIRGYVEELPESLFKVPQLRDLELGATAIKTLPKNILDAKKLRKLIINESTIEVLPHDIGELESLVELYLWELPKLSTLPESLASASLNTFQVKKLSFTSLPKEVQERYGLTKHLATAEPYLKVYNEMYAWLRYYLHVPLIKGYIEDYEANNDGLKAKIGELTLAVSKCYKDEEHGPSSQKYYASLIAENAPQPVLDASECIKGHFYLDKSSNLDNVSKQLAKIEDFDAMSFVEIVEAMIENGPKYL